MIQSFCYVLELHMTPHYPQKCVCEPYSLALYIFHMSYTQSRSPNCFLNRFSFTSTGGKYSLNCIFGGQLHSINSFFFFYVNCLTTREANCPQKQSLLSPCISWCGHQGSKKFNINIVHCAPECWALWHLSKVFCPWDNKTCSGWCTRMN